MAKGTRKGGAGVAPAPAKDPAAARGGTPREIVEGQVEVRDTRELGTTGLAYFGGIIDDDFLDKVNGAQGIRTYDEMALNHPVVGAVLYAIESVLRGVEWNVEAASPSKDDMDTADFVNSCLDDMTLTWAEFLSEALTMLRYGFAPFEIVYKVRQGYREDNRAHSSRFDDHKIGWAKLRPTAQDTIQSFYLDDSGDLLGVEQLTQTGHRAYIPSERLLLMRTTSAKNNPKGRSLLRNAVVPYLMQRKVQEIELIGVERDLAGLPVVTVPARYLDPKAPLVDKKLLSAVREMLRTIRRNEQEGLIFPGDRDDKGNPMFEFKLVTSAGQRQLNTSEIITRYDTRIAQVLLADFIMVGHQATGSFALSDSKTSMFVTSLRAILDSIASVINRHAIPRLMRINGLNTEATPVLKFGPIAKAEIGQLAAMFSSLAGAGMPLFPDQKLENHVRDLAGLPQADMSTDVGSGGGEGEEIAEPGTDPKNEEGTNAGNDKQPGGGIGVAGEGKGDGEDN